MSSNGKIEEVDAGVTTIEIGNVGQLNEISMDEFNSCDNFNLPSRDRTSDSSNASSHGTASVDTTPSIKEKDEKTNYDASCISINMHSSSMFNSRALLKHIPSLNPNGKRTYPTTIEWINIEKVVRVNKLEGKGKEDRVILNKVSGISKPGEVHALMGPSGCGKTSLLNIVGGRSNEFEGSIHLNKKPFNKAMKRNICYVLQEDIMFANLKVRETVMFTALLRLPKSMTKREKMSKVDEVLTSLGISHCANTIIGNQFKRGVSGGEKKRVNIACELLTDPTIILLDEPTSGLDSSTCYKLIATLKHIAENDGKTIMASIHQPASQVLYLFDRLTLMSKGNIVFSGKCEEALSFFSQCGYECQQHYNPADFYLEILTDEPEHSQHLIEQWEKSRADISIEPTKEAAGVKCEKEDKWPINQLEQTWILLQRSFRQNKYEILSPINMFQSFILSVILGLLWFQTGHEAEQIPERLGLVFFIIVYWGFNPLISALTIFTSERHVIQKERSSGSYRLSAYFVAKCLSELPLLIFMPTVFVIIVYWMTNLARDPLSFFGFLFVVLLNAVIAQSLGLAIGAAIADFKHAIVCASVAMLSVMLLGGFYTNDLPTFISWAKYLSFVYYSYHAACLLEFDGQRDFTCGPENTSSYGSCTNGVVTGDEVIAYLGIELSFGVDIAILVGILIVLRLTSYFALRFLHPPVQN